MPFIGNQPALSYTSFAKQDFTTSATTSYTLDNPVANANELALFINFVRQEPTTAYSASGTSLTLTSATSASDDMYCVFLGKAVQTVNPPNSSVGASQIVDASITSGKLASGVLPTNTPAFKAHRNSNFTAADSTSVVIVCDDEEWDTDTAYDTTTGRFTVPAGKAGKYMFYASARNATGVDTTRFLISLRKNGTGFAQANNNNGDEDSAIVSGATTLAVGDYVDATIYQNTGSSRTIFGDDPGKTTFFGFKIIGA